MLHSELNLSVVVSMTKQRSRKAASNEPVVLQQRASGLYCRGLNTAMEAEGPEELGYSGPDFPEELDEFLAYCVREHDDDFEVLGLCCVFGLHKHLTAWSLRVCIRSSSCVRRSPKTFWR